MEVRQINLKLPENLVEAAESYVKNFGFRNIQELAAESIREKVFEKNEFDETFSGREVRLIDDLIEQTIKRKDFGTEEELKKILKNES